VQEVDPVSDHVHGVPAFGGVAGQSGPGLRGVSHCHPIPGLTHTHSVPPGYAHSWPSLVHAAPAGAAAGQSLFADAAAQPAARTAHASPTQVARSRQSPRGAAP
jgi:hypothetical protein